MKQRQNDKKYIRIDIIPTNNNKKLKDMKTIYSHLKQTIDEVSLRYPYSITGTPKNLFAWGVGRIGKQRQKSKVESRKSKVERQESGFRIQGSGFRAGLLRRVAAVLLCLLTIGVA